MTTILTIPAIEVSRKFPLNISEEDRKYFAPFLSMIIEEVNVLRMMNSIVVNEGAIIKGLRVVKGTMLSNDKGEIIKIKLRDIIKMFLFWPRIDLKPEERYLVIHNIYSRTYYHWVAEVLPRLFLLRDLVNNSTLLLPEDHCEDFHRQSLELFNVNSILNLKEQRKYFVPELHTSTQIGTMANYHPLVLRQTADYLKSRVVNELFLGEKIYISRRKASRRRIVNEIDLELCLTRLGFRSVCLEDFDFKGQISIMKNCRRLVGLHGAGLVNMIFMPQGSRVMELRMNDAGENYFYFGIASAMKFDYYYQFCNAMGHVSVQQADVFVDIEVFKKNLEIFL